MSMGFRLVVLIVLMAGVGCQRVTARDVLGVYFADYDGDRDELTIRSDGTYSHKIGTGPERRTDDGKWIFETLQGEVLGISFKDFRFRARGGGIKMAGIWHVEAQSEMFVKKTKLCFDPDLDSCFLQE
jgi:hypothetical protein